MPGREPLDAVILTGELSRRESKPANFETDSRALIALAKHLANSPTSILQKLVEVAVEALHAGSAGVSLLHKQTGDFYWPAIAGEWRPNIGGGTPRKFGPCGTVLDRDSVLLFAHPERHFPYLAAASPAIEEALLVPFYVRGKAVGTVWLISHDTARRFDLEDQRVLNSLGEFAAAAFQALEGIEALESRSQSLADAQDRVVMDLDRLSRVHEAVNRIHRCTTLQSATRTILDAAIALTGANKGMLQLLNSKLGGLEVAEQTGFDEDFLARFKLMTADDISACSRAMRRQTRVAIEDVTLDEACAPLCITAAAADFRAVQATPLIGANGELLGVLSTHFREPHVFSEHEQRMLDLFTPQASEVIERNLKDRALVAAKERIETTLSASQIGTWVWDSVNDRVYADANVMRLFSVTPEEAEGGPIERYVRSIHPEDVSRVQSLIARALETSGRYEADYRLVQSDGTIRWVSARGQVQCDETGRAIRFPGVITDTTERHSAEAKELNVREALAEREAFLQCIVASSADCIKVLDLSGKIEWMSDGSLIAMEIAVFSHVAGADWPGFWKGDLSAEAKRALAAARAGDIGRFQGFCPTFKGTPRWWDVVVTPILGPTGQVVRLLATSRDITQQHRAEEALTGARDIALQASGAKDRFLAALSHELRTPLNPILLVASEAANNATLSADMREDWEMVRKNVELETRLIEDLLDLTRATHGKMSLKFAQVDVAEVLRDAIRNVAEEIETKQVAVRQNIPEDLPKVSGDPVRMQQIFWNLLRNAVKFTPAGGTVNLAAAVSESKDRLKITVTDTGIGLTHAEIERLFIPFSQGEHANGPTGSVQFGGLGLGLSISSQIMELHEGTLTAASEGLGKGSTFTIEFPLHPGRQAEPSSRLQLNEKSPQKIKRLRILLVEDHEPTRNTMTRLLGMRGHQVEAVSSGLEFRQREGLSVDVVLCDIGLPDINGYDLFKEMRERYPQMVGFALSGYGTDEDIEQAKVAGFIEHLVKPVAIANLDRALAKHFPE
jgi:PAS domain S-box-containing protein